MSNGLSRNLSNVHRGCAWCNSPPLPLSTYRSWNKFSILVSWIYFQVIFDKPIWLLVECMDCSSKVDYRRNNCSSSMSRRWFLSVSRTVSPCSKVHHQCKSQLELRCFYWLFSFVPFLSLKAAWLPILITTQTKSLYMLFYNIINSNIRYHRRRILETCTTDRTTLVFL